MMRINATLTEDIIENLDNIAYQEKSTRSMLLREAAMKLIDEYKRSLEEKQKKACIKHAITIQDKLRKKAGIWDGISELRKWREISK